MKNQLLLLEDVDGLGRSGDIVTAKPGYARNFLFPKKKAIRAEKHLVKLQEKLKQERAVKAQEDKKASEKFAKELIGKTLKTEVKIDTEGHMYGSVTAQEVVVMLNEQLGTQLEKKNVLLPRPIRKLGVHEVDLRLAEGVAATVTLEVAPEEKPAE